MAFRQPIVAPRRPDPLHEPEYSGPTIQVSAQQTSHDESREWVLFSPSQAHSTSQTRTNFTVLTPRTEGHSRISDFGSIGITVRSDGNERDLAKDGDDGARDEEELDSLDEGLHAFHDPTGDRYTGFLGRSGTILPTHDGLGMFPPSSPQVQEQLWQFEQHNPRKRMAETPLLNSSLRRHLDTTVDADGTKLDSERRQRIENWRIDQARLLLDEIEKQSRSMRRSESGGKSDASASAGRVAQDVESLVGDTMHQLEEGVEGDGGGGGSSNQAKSAPKETLLEGMTRRLCDLLGIDDFILSIILGDALPVADGNTSSELASLSLPDLDLSLNHQPSVSSLLPEWHGRLLDRLTRELGFLIQQNLSENPGAFSTHLYLPDSDIAKSTAAPSPSLTQEQLEKSLPLHDIEHSSSSLGPHFRPTLQVQPEPPASTSKCEATDAALWGVEEEGSHLRLPSIAEERAYWERTPDVKSIFRLLQTRFSNEHEQQQSSASNPNLTTVNKTTAASNLASLRRASVICQHHPLVSKTDGPLRRSTRNILTNHQHHHHHHHHHHHPHHHNHHHHHHSNRQIFSLRRAGNSNGYSYSYSYSNNSCASSSLLKKSKRASGSSRNYWDLDL